MENKVTNQYETIQEEMLLTDNRLLGQEDEYSFNCYCRDGVALCIFNGEEDDPKPKHRTVVLTYPTMEEVLANENMMDNIRMYRFSGANVNILPNDVAMTFGKVRIMSEATTELLIKSGLINLH